MWGDDPLFLSKLRPNPQSMFAGEPCLEWQGALDRDGYGKIRRDGETQQAHVFAWKLADKEIPEGFELDHKCRNRKCCNVHAHIEAVTKEENLRRTLAPSGRGPLLARTGQNRFRLGGEVNRQE